MNLSYYCFCYGEKTPKMILPSQKNIMLGCAGKYVPEDYLRDDTGDNISWLNSHFGQTTGLFWLWKNAPDEYIGAMTYRLLWKDPDVRNNLAPNVLIVPKEKDVNTAVRGSINHYVNLEQHFSWCHGSSGLSLLYGLLNMTERKMKPEMLRHLKEDSNLIPFNMFVAHRDVFSKICDILFDVTFAYYNEYNYLFESMEKSLGQSRVIDFLSERILHCIYKNIDYFIPGVKIYQAEVIDIPH
jgi:hypothetical protein